MAKYANIGIETNNYVATVEIQRPPYNFFDYILIQEIADAFAELEADNQCRAIVLAAQGQCFCAGANLGSGADDGDEGFSEAGFRTVTRTLYNEAVRLFQCKKPIVGAIHGAAIGGGLGVALVPDFRITCPQATFAANFTKLGIHPGFGLTVTLPDIIGQQAANMMFYTGRRIKGEEAVKIGLADALTEQSNVRQMAQDLAAEIAANAPLAVESTRATMRAGLADRISKQTEHELKEQQWLRATEDAAEGILSVSERRPGNFKKC